MDKQKAAIGDFLRLGANAFASGLVAAIALAVVTLALAGGAQAASLNDAKTGTLMLRTGTAGEYVVAPKVETEVAIQVTGMIARTRLSQVFHNPGIEFAEGVYVFPLPEKAAVDHLWMRIGERVIEGQVKEKEDARRAYEKAKSEGRKAALVEQQRPNLFTNAVAHIGPGENVRITIEYQQTLAYEKGEYRLRFPLAVTPRYVPGSASDAIPDVPKAIEAGEFDGPAQEPGYAGHDCGGPVNPVDIAVVIDVGMPIANVVSSYHEAVVQKEGGHRTAVYLTQEQESADRDFELKWTVAPGAAPQAALFTQDIAGTGYALIMVVPPEPNAAERAAFQRVPRETILIVDTSGSMAGASMEQARAAVIHALSTLTERDRFNVLEFNSITRPLYSMGALPATPQNLANARAWVASLKAGGGTEMAPALEFALDGRETSGYLRQVVFMTDGGVANEDALFKLIERRLGSSRLFTVGIGSAPNGHFMTKAAQFGRGTFTQIGDVREVEEKMRALFARIEAPVLQDVAIRWADGRAVETFPPRVPDLYLGEPIIVSASAAHFAQVTVSGTRGNQPWSVVLTPARDGDANGVGALWARAKIASLMDEMTRGADATAIRPQVVKVALEHHLVSAYTSLVAVDVSVTNPAGNVRTALVRASPPQGWSGDLPQTDTAATLQLLLGLLALASAGIVAVIGRTVPARRVA